MLPLPPREERKRQEEEGNDMPRESGSKRRRLRSNIESRVEREDRMDAHNEDSAEDTAI